METAAGEVSLLTCSGAANKEHSGDEEGEAAAHWMSQLSWVYLRSALKDSLSAIERPPTTNY